MKKKIAFVLGMILVVLSLGACGTDPTTVDYNGYSYDELETACYTNAQSVMELSSYMQMIGLSAEELPKDAAETLIGQYGFSQAQIDATDQWISISEEFGLCVEADEDSFSIDKSGNTLTTNLTLKFEEKDVDFQVVYDYYSMEVTGLTIEPVYSIGEKMQKAGMNTIISMSVVFLVLILISLIIYAFNIFPYLEKKKKAKAAIEKQPEVPAAAPVEQPEVPQLTDDTELVAVIAAAIAAGEGTSTSDFVVRSINRR